MISTRTSCDIALAISTACCSPTVNVLAGALGSRSTSSAASTSAASRRIARQLTTPPAVAVADEDVLGDREVGEDQRLLVDRHDAVPLGIGGRADVDRLAIHEDLTAVGACRVRS